MTNKTLVGNLKKRLMAKKGACEEELLGILWAYCTMVRSPNGQTPFALVYGSEVVISVEVGMPSFQVQYFNERTNEEGLCGNLDLA